MKQKLYLEQYGKAWRAVARLGPELRNASFVFGGGTEDGPWLQGEGNTPEDALGDCLLRVGRAYMAMRAAL